MSVRGHPRRWVCSITALGIRMILSPSNCGAAMKATAKKSVSLHSDEKMAPVTVSFGSVTVQVMPPTESERQANIAAGQAALRRGLHTLLKPGIKLARKRGVPYYFGIDDRPGWMIQELDGKNSVGRFVDGEFVAEVLPGGSAYGDEL